MTEINIDSNRRNSKTKLDVSASVSGTSPTSTSRKLYEAINVSSNRKKIEASTQIGFDSQNRIEVQKERLAKIREKRLREDTQTDYAPVEHVYANDPISVEKHLRDGNNYQNPERYLLVPLMPFVLDVVATNVFSWQKMVKGARQNFTRQELVSLLYNNQLEMNEPNIKKEIKVCRIASRKWFNNVQTFLTSPLYNIEDYHYYIDYCADVLKTSLPFDPYTKDGKNKILEFAYWYYDRMDPRRRRQTVKNNYETLIQILRDSSDLTDFFSNPFIPKNFISPEQALQFSSLERRRLLTANSSALGGPKEITFNIVLGNGQELEVRNFLRNWTEYTKNKDGIIAPGVSETKTIEVIPPEGSQWVPEEYRDQIYREFDLYEFKWIEPVEFMRFYMLHSMYNDSMTSINDPNVWAKMEVKSAKDTTPELHLMVTQPGPTPVIWGMTMGTTPIVRKTWYGGEKSPPITSETAFKDWVAVKKLLRRHYRPTEYLEDREELPGKARDRDDLDRDFAFYKFLLNVPVSESDLDRKQIEEFVMQFYVNKKIVYRFRENVPLGIYRTSIKRFFESGRDASKLDLGGLNEEQVRAKKRELFVIRFANFVKMSDPGIVFDSNSQKLAQEYVDILNQIYDLVPQ